MLASVGGTTTESFCQGMGKPGMEESVIQFELQVHYLLSIRMGVQKSIRMGVQKYILVCMSILESISDG